MRLTSAYDQLQPYERHFVDMFVLNLEGEAASRHERISNTAMRAISADIVAASNGLLDRALVCAAITERVKEIAAETELTPRRVIREYMASAFANIADYGEMTEYGVHWQFHKCTRDQMSAVQSIKTKERIGHDGVLTQEVEIKLHPKQGMLDKLGDMMGIFEANSPYYRDYAAKPVEAAALPAGTSDEAAAEAYQRVLNAVA